MPNVTLAFDEAVKGWTSEFTFLPDAGLSLNNNFYTFHNGRIWRHNSQTADRNTFYGVTSDTEITFVFNELPTIVKNFKNIGFEGTPSVTDPDGTGELGWSASLETNIEKGVVNVQDFVTKEGKNYSWIQGEDLGFMPDLKSAAVGGIGSASVTTTERPNNDVNLPPTGGTLTFSKIPGALGVGDIIYSTDAPDALPQVVGVVTGIRNGVVTWTKSGTNNADNQNNAPTTSEFYLYAKPNSDKSGIIGYYSIVTMTNNKSSDEIELFSVNTRAFISTK